MGVYCIWAALLNKERELSWESCVSAVLNDREQQFHSHPLEGTHAICKDVPVHYYIKETYRLSATGPLKWSVFSFHAKHSYNYLHLQLQVIRMHFLCNIADSDTESPRLQWETLKWIHEKYLTVIHQYNSYLYLFSDSGYIKEAAVG